MPLVRIRAALERLVAPGYSTCDRCRRPQRFAPRHDTMLGPWPESRGASPLCEQCWEDLGTAERRQPYYRALWERWKAHGTHVATWEEIRNAVMDEAQEHPSPPERCGGCGAKFGEAGRWALCGDEPTGITYWDHVGGCGHEHLTDEQRTAITTKDR
jgi:hypothetical protein